MLPEVQGMTPRKYNKLDAPVTMRIRFRKIGNLQYISHLDLQRTLQRIVVRARIPVWYTQGFNPHMKIVFSTPLSIGAESVCEMVDLRVDSDISCEELVAALNEQVTDELRILDAYIPETKFSDIVWSSYEIVIYSPALSEDTTRNIRETLASGELLATKKTKSGEKTINVVPLVGRLEPIFNREKGAIEIQALLRADGENYLNPELLLSSLNEKCHTFEGGENESWHSIMRTENYFEDGKTVFR